MAHFPPFPSQSLYGSFPSFPVNYVSIPNIADLPGWILRLIAYRINPINYPYKNPPSIPSLFSIPYPNLLGIPAWIAKIFAYGVGWVGAFILWTVKVIVIAILLAVGTTINTANTAINWTIQEIESISSHAGIFAPVVAALLMGMLLVVLVVGIFAAINLLKGLGGAAE